MRWLRSCPVISSAFSPNAAARWLTCALHLVCSRHAARLEEARKLIKQIDVPVRQVMIEARVVEASDNSAKTWRENGYASLDTYRIVIPPTCQYRREWVSSTSTTPLPHNNAANFHVNAISGTAYVLHVVVQQLIEQAVVY